LEQNPFEGVLAIKVPSTSFGPEIIEQKAPKNIEGLSPVGEATRVVAMEVGGVILFFEHGLPKKNKGPGCRNPTLAKCGGEAQHSQSWGFGVLRDSRMFRV